MIRWILVPVVVGVSLSVACGELDGADTPPPFVDEGPEFSFGGNPNALQVGDPPTPEAVPGLRDAGSVLLDAGPNDGGDGGDDGGNDAGDAGDAGDSGSEEAGEAGTEEPEPEPEPSPEPPEGCGDCGGGGGGAPPWTGSLGGTWGTDNYSNINCPGLGKLGAEVSLNGTGSTSPVQCPSCVGRSEFGASLGVKASVCGAEMEIEAAGSMTAEKKHCKECNEDTNTFECSDDYCLRKGGEASLGYTFSKFHGAQPPAWNSGGVSAEFRCGAQLTVPLTARANFNSTGAYGQPECGCAPGFDATAGLGASATGALVCHYDVSGYGLHIAGGCSNCASLTLGANATGGFNTEGLCLELQGSLALNAGICQTIGWGWLEVGVEVDFHLGGTCTAGDCSQSPDADMCNADPSNGATVRVGNDLCGL